MASRPILPPFQVITNGDMVGDITSLPTIIQNLSMMSYDISWSGTSPVGVITVEVSNTYAQNADGTQKTAGNWTALVLSSPTPVSGNTGTGFIDIDQLGSYAIRLKYTHTSGIGTLQATFSAKVA